MQMEQHGNLSDWASGSYISNTFRYVLNELADATGDVLTVGGGDGSFEALLAARNPSLRITAIELNGVFAEKLERHCDEVIAGDFLAHDFDRTFDYVVSIDVIEHLYDTDAFLTRFGSVMSPGGVAYLQTPNLASWHGRLSLLFGYMPPAMEVSDVKCYFGKFGMFRYEDSIHHVRIFTLGALREMCRFYGFDIRRTVGIDHYFPALFTHLPWIAGSVCLKMRQAAGSGTKTPPW